MGTTGRRRYTEDQRAAAVADVVAMGVIEAAKKHGVPQSCMSRWAKDAGVRRGMTTALPQAAAARSKKVALPESEPKVTPGVAAQAG